MAEASRSRSVLGRVLAGLGIAWVFWAFFGPAIGLRFGNSLIDLPILPGIVIFFIGRTLSGRTRRRSSRSQQDAPTDAPPPPESQVRPVPTPGRSNLESLPLIEPAPVSDVILDAFDAPEPDLPAPDEIPVRKTSAEMVAEARRRFGRRP